MVDTETYTIESPDGDTDDVELPPTIVDLLGESDEGPATVVGDVVLQAFAQQAHIRVHHAEGETPEALEEANETLEELFEERFGLSLAEAMGHDH